MPHIRRLPNYLKDYAYVKLNINPKRMTSILESSSGITYPISNILNYDKFSQKHRAYLAYITNDEKPQSYTRAIKHTVLREAMAQEIKALEDNDTWELTHLPQERKLIGCRLVYKIKHKATCDIEKYKVRLVAKRYTQIEGRGFNGTFAPVAKVTTVRCLLTVAVVKGWKLHQMDVDNAFLHVELIEEVYMSPPQGYKVPNKDLVCILKKSLYGLKQASRNSYWNSGMQISNVLRDVETLISDKNTITR